LVAKGTTRLDNSDRSSWLLRIIKNWGSPDAQHLINRLRRHARNHASLNVPYTFKEDATNAAVEKALDWLMSEAPMKVPTPPGPWFRLLTIIRNAVRDFRRTIPHVEQGLWIEEGSDLESAFHLIEQKRVSKENEIKKAKAIQLGQYAGEKQPPAEPQRHPILALVLGLLKTNQWFISSGEVEENLELAARFNHTHLPPFYDGEGERIMKRQRRQRWWHYNHAKGLLKTIRASKEREVMRLLLWGFKPVEIAKLFGVSKPYISKVTSKWKKGWGWGNARISKTRIYFLTHYLATIYDDCTDRPTRDRGREFSRRIGFENLRNKKSPAGEEDLFRQLLHLGEQLYNRVTKEIMEGPQLRDLEEDQIPTLLKACHFSYIWWLETRDYLF
jgi:hypothetical protein